MRWVLYGGLGVVLLVLAVLAIGWSLPVGHRASRSLTLQAPPDAVFQTISEFARLAEWRSDVSRVEVEGAPGPGQRITEFGSNGEMPYVVEELDPPRRLRTRIAGTGMAFGGTWTFELAPAPGGGTTISLTEDGEIYNAFFRVMARFVFGYESTIDAYLKDLQVRVASPR